METMPCQVGTAVIFPLSKEEEQEKLALLAQIIEFASVYGDRGRLTARAYDLWTVRDGDRIVPIF
jgi:hypothetical protein